MLNEIRQAETEEMLRRQLKHWNRELEIRLGNLEKVQAAVGPAEVMVAQAQKIVNELAQRLARLDRKRTDRK